MMVSDRLEIFPELESIPWIRHVFTLRQPDIPIVEDRSATLATLRRRHEEILESRGIPLRSMAAAEQIHGAGVAWITAKPHLPTPGVDGLATNVPGLPLGVYVADCCAIYLTDTEKRAVAVLHSGLKGTQQNIAGAGVESLVRNNRSKTENLIAVLSPCIGGCCYREEFADRIESQLKTAGVSRIARRDRCTACHPDRYYSYNREKGRTGRMLAAVMIAPDGDS